MKLYLIKVTTTATENNAKVQGVVGTNYYARNNHYWKEIPTKGYDFNLMKAYAYKSEAGARQGIARYSKQFGTMLHYRMWGATMEIVEVEV